MGQTQLLFIFISFKSLIKTLLTAIEINFNLFENELKSWRGPVTSPISFVRILTINKWVFLSHPFSLSFSHSLGHSLFHSLYGVTLALQSISRLRGPLHALYLHTHVRWSPISNPSALVPLHWLRQEVINKAVKFFFVEKWSN